MKRNVGRRAFSVMEVRAIFSGYIYSDYLISHEQPRDWHYWVPILAWFTGASSEEIGSLTTDDVIHDRENYFLLLGNNGRLAQRKLPVHTEIIEMGLLDYIEFVKEQNESRLFFDLTPKGGRYSEKMRVWFTGDGERPGYMQKCDVPPVDSEGKKTALSSFRINFEEHFKRVCKTLQVNPTYYLAYSLGTKVRGNIVESNQIDATTLKQIIELIPVPIKELNWFTFTNRMH